MSFAIAVWLCLLAIIFVTLQGAISGIYGDIYHGADVVAVYLTMFFAAWSIAVAVAYFAISLIAKTASSKK